MADQFVVRLFDRSDFAWYDVSRPVSREEADRIWREKTRNGTEAASYADGDYFSVFPAGTRMLYHG